MLCTPNTTYLFTSLTRCLCIHHYRPIIDMYLLSLSKHFFFFAPKTEYVLVYLVHILKKNILFCFYIEIKNLK